MTPLVPSVSRSVFGRVVQEAAVERPPLGDHSRISPWLEEQVWGHRLYTQSPWLVFLEFLTVAEACEREGRLLDEQGHFYPLSFKPYKRMFLRNILWNNDSIKRISEESLDSDAAWEKWLRNISARAQGVTERDFGYLKNRFQSFEKFASLIEMLLDSSVESESNKRWTSRFVFPFGPNALYEDIAISPSGGFERQYINFGRTGELLYLMLCRSSSAGELRPHLSNLLRGDNQWNQLLGLLQPGPDDDLSLRGKSYLPYKTHPCFDDLGRDWLNVFKLGLPGFDAIEHLVTLSALHIMLYQLRVAQEWCGLATGEQRKTFFVCEVVAPRKTFVREQSVLNFQQNNVLTTQAVTAYLDAIERCPEWQEAVEESATPDEAMARCRHILQSEVWWGEKTDYEGTPDPRAMLRELREVALRRHSKEVSEVHRSYSRDIGLVSRKGTTKFRYAPNDPLIKTLLLANVTHRMELQEFLHQLFEHYGLVFGPREAQRVLPAEDFDPKPFAANAARLEQRLGSLGLLRRLSDGCAYVVNPHALTS